MREGDTQGAVYEVVLDSEPQDDVVVRIAASSAAVETLPRSLVFNAQNWATAQTVRVIGVADEDTRQERATLRHSVSGGAYDGFAAASVRVTVEDDDVGLSARDAQVTEGGNLGFVVVSTRPAGVGGAGFRFRVTAAAGDSASPGEDFTGVREGTARIASGQSRVTIPVGTVDDGVDEADETLTFTLLDADAPWKLLDAVAVGTIIDNEESPEVTLSLSPASVDEDGAASRVTARLSRPSAAPTTVFVSAAASGGAAASDFALSANRNLVIAPGDLSSTGTVTVSAPNNAWAQGARAVTLSAQVRNELGAVPPSPVTLSIVDDDTRAIVAMPAAVTIAEGGQASYTVSLSARPQSAVTVAVAPRSGADASLVTQTGSLTFTPDNWRVPQTVLLLAREDDGITDGAATLRHTATSADNVWQGKTADVQVTVRDNDTAGLVFTPPQVFVPEGGTATVGVRLAARPDFALSANGRPVKLIMRNASEQDAALDPTADPDITLLGGTIGTLTFGNFDVDDWDKTWTRTVKAAEDDDTVNGQRKILVRYLGPSSDRQGYGNVSATLVVTEVDNDVAGVFVDGQTLRVEEGSSASYTARLNAPPDEGHTVTVTARSEAASVTLSNGSASGSSLALTFTAANWKEPQTVTVTAAEDTDVEDLQTLIRHTVAAPVGSDYRGVTAPAVTLRVVDDDIALSVADARAPEGEPLHFVVTATRAAPEGGLPFTWTATAAPSDTAASDDFIGAGRPVTARIASGQTSVVAPVSVVDDRVDEADETFTLSIAGGAGVTVADSEATGTIIDNDEAPFVTLALAAPTVGENGGSTAVTATLSHLSSAATTITVAAAPLAATGASSADYRLSVNRTLVVAAGQLASTGAVTLTAVDNDEGGPSRSVAVTATAVNRVGVSAPDAVTLTITDDDQGVVLSRETLEVVEESVDGASYLMALNARPEAAVTVTVESEHPDIVITPARLTFNAVNWAREQTITVTARADEDFADETAKLAHTVTGGDYAGQKVADVTVSIRDDDIGLSVADAAADESDEAIYFPVTLTRPAPAGGVTGFWGVDFLGIRILGNGRRISNPFIGSRSGVPLSFTIPEGKSSALARVPLGHARASFANNFDEDDRTFPFTVGVDRSLFPFARISRGQATGTVRDDDAPPGFTLEVSPDTVSEGAEFPVRSRELQSRVLRIKLTPRLSHPSTADTTVRWTAEPAEGNGARPNEFAWQSRGAQQSTIAAAYTPPPVTEAVHQLGLSQRMNNRIAEPPRRIKITATAENSRGLANDTASAFLTITDDDRRGITLTPAALEVVEGEAGEWTVALTSEPTEPVTVEVEKKVAGRASPGVAIDSGASLEFKQGDWSVPQTVRVTTTKDADTRNERVTFAHRASGSGYAETTLPELQMTVRDVGELSLSLADGAALTVDEGGVARLPLIANRAPDNALAVLLTVRGGDGARDADLDGFRLGRERMVPVTFSGRRGTLEIATRDDGLPEAPLESFSVTLGATGAYALGDVRSRDFSIRDNDGIRLQAAANVALFEGAALSMTAEAVATDNDPAETFSLRLASVGGYRLLDADNEVSGAIRAPSLVVVSNARVTEGDSGNTPVEFTVTAIPAPAVDVTFNWRTHAGAEDTARAGVDFADESGVGRIRAGQKTTTISVPVFGDELPESNESFTLTLAQFSAGGRTIGGRETTATAIIANDDGLGIFVEDVEQAEGNSGSADLEFVVTATAEPAADVTFRYATTGGTAQGKATPGSDFTSLSGIGVLKKQTRRLPIRVSIHGDTEAEPDETFTLTLSDLSAPARFANGATATATGVIRNDDNLPQIALAGATLAKVTEGQNITIGLRANRAVAGSVPVALTLAASGGSDFNAADVEGDLTGAFMADFNNTQSATVTIATVDDPLVEKAQESYTVTLAESTRYTRGAQYTANGILAENDYLAVVMPVQFPEKLLEGQRFGVQLVAQTTTNGADYAPATGFNAVVALTWKARLADDIQRLLSVPASVAFAAGRATATVRMNEHHQAEVSGEGVRDFWIEAADGYVLNNKPRMITRLIQNPRVTITDARVAEGDSGDTGMTFTVSADGSTANGAVSFNVTVGAAGDTALARTGANLNLAASRVFDVRDNVPRQTLPAIRSASPSMTFNVPVIGDTIAEDDETFTVTLSNLSSNARFAGGVAAVSATGTIVDDEQPQIRIADSEVVEGNNPSNNLNQMVFEVTAHRPLSADVTFTYSATLESGDTAGTGDFGPVSGLSARLPKGANSMRIRVPIIGDRVVEHDETFTVTLSNLQGPARFAGGGETLSATGVILDDDTANHRYTLKLSPQAVAEDADPNDSAQTQVTVTAERAGGARLQRDTALRLAVAAGAASEGVDYRPVVPRNLTIRAGEAQGKAFFDLKPIDDEVSEGAETVQVTATLAGTRIEPVLLTITDDEPVPAVSIAVAPQAIYEAGAVSNPPPDTPGSARFTVSLSGERSMAVQAPLTVSGTADSGDYRPTLPARLTFAAGETEKTLTVTARDDALAEAEQELVVTLGTPSGAILGAPSSASLRIIDNDGVRVSIADRTVAEGESAVLSVTASPAPAADTVFSYTVTAAPEDSASAGSDFTAAPVARTLTLNGGATQAFIRVPTLEDNRVEGDETFTVSLLDAPGGVVFADAAATVTIEDDDHAPQMPELADVRLQPGEQVSLDATASDADDGDTITYVWRRKPEETTPALPPRTALNRARLVFTPAGAGFYTFTVTATDNHGNATTQDVKVTVGTFVTISAAPSVIKVGVPVQLRAQAPGMNGTLTWKWSRKDGETSPALPDITGSDSATLSFTPTAAGVYTMTASVSDGSVRRSKTVVINVLPATVVSVEEAVTVDESAGFAAVRVSASAALDRRIAFNIAYSDDTAEGAAEIANGDYDNDALETVTFMPGDAEQTIRIPVASDLIAEGDEAFGVTLSPAGALPPGTRLGAAASRVTITDDDELSTDWVVVVDPVLVGEGDGEVEVKATARRSGLVVSSRVTPLKLLLSGGTAVSGTDYRVADEELAVTVPAGSREASAVFRLTLLDDRMDEEDVTVGFTGELAGASFTPATLTIEDSDPAPVVYFTRILYEGGKRARLSTLWGEGEDSSVVFNVRFKFSGITSGKEVTIPVKVSGSATSGVDYSGTIPETLRIAPGEKEASFTLAVTDDSLVEETENIFVELGSPVNARFESGSRSNRQQSVSIYDNDEVEPTLTLSAPAVVTEGEKIALTVTSDMDIASVATLRLQLEPLSGSGFAAADIRGGLTRAVSGVSFGGGRSATISIPTVDDAALEGSERYRVKLLSGKGYAVGKASAVNGRIMDNDGILLTSASGRALFEGETLTVALRAVATTDGGRIFLPSADFADTVAVSWDYVGVSAADFTAPPAQVVFSGGSGVARFVIAADGDATENLAISLGGAVGQAVLAASGSVTGKIHERSLLTLAGQSVSEGDSGYSRLVMTARAQPAPPVDVVFTWTALAKDGDTATAGEDFIAVTRPVTARIRANTQKAAFAVRVVGDTRIESDETFSVALGGVGRGGRFAADAAGVTAAATIVDDDRIVLSAADVKAAEGSPFAFTVRASVAPVADVTFRYAVTAESGDTALAGEDFTAVSGTAKIAANTTAVDIPVNVVNDALDEADETFTLTLSDAPADIVIGDGVARGTIADNDAPPSVSVTAPAAVTEGDNGTTDMDFTVSLSAPGGRVVTVDYALDNSASTAASGSDFSALSGATLTFAAGETSKTVTVKVTGDQLDEDNETVALKLSNAVNATPGTVTASGSIVDDDSSPVLSELAPVTVAQGQVVVVKAVAVDADGDPLTWRWARKAGEKPALPRDTALNAARLTFTPSAGGLYTMTVTVADGHGNTDSRVVSIVVVGAGQVALPAVMTVGEGAGSVVIPVTAGTAFTERAVFAVGYRGGTATAADYGNGASQVIFAPGESNATITVPIRQDRFDEEDETFTVTISAKGALPDGVTLGNAQTTVTIVDDDPPRELQIRFFRPLPEGDSGDTTLTFLVADNIGLIGRAMTVDYALDASSTATEGVDFTLPADRTLTFPAGVTPHRSIPVTVKGDTLDEDDETVVLRLVNPSGAVLSSRRAVAVGRITDDDPLPQVSLSVSAATLAEDGGEATFTVELDAVSGRPVTVPLSVGGSAARDTDWSGEVAAQLVFAPGTRTQTFTVTAVGDHLPEGDEKIVVTLGTLVNAGGTGSVTLTITDDDTAPVVDALADREIRLGETVDITATGNDADRDALRWSWTRKRGERVPELPGDTDLDNARLVFTPPATGIYTMTVTADDGNGNKDSEEVVITVLPAAQVKVPQTLAVTEGTDSNAVVTISVDAAFGKEVMFAVSYSGTASGAGDPANGDYDNDAVESVTFGAADTTKDITIPITDDSLAEGDETIVVTLALADDNTLPAGHVAGNLVTTVTLADNDTLSTEWTLSLAPKSVTEDSGATVITVTARRAGTAVAVSDTDIAVSVAGGTATAGSDFTAVRDFTIGVPAGASSATGTFSLTVTDDALDEASETIVVSGTLSGNTISDAQLAISDNDGQSEVSVAAPEAVVEGDERFVLMKFPVTLDAVSGQAVQVNYRVSAQSTASFISDYILSTSSPLTIAAGRRSAEIIVVVNGDESDEADETVVIELSNAVNATLGTATATGTITDDDSSPVLAAIDDVTARLGRAVEITASATDADGDTVSYAWTRVSGPELPQGTKLGQAALSFTPEAVGRYVLAVTADDDNGNRDSEEVVITVAAKAQVKVPQTLAVTEGTDANAVVTISVDEAFGEEVTFNVTYSGTATGAPDPADGDYDNDAVTAVTFGAGDTTRDIEIPLTDDALNENSETIIVAITPASPLPAGFEPGNAQTVVTITDNDRIRLDIADVSGSESGNLQFTVSASSAPAADVTFRYTVTAESGDTATEGADFTAVKTARTATIAAKATRTTITVAVTDDAIDEEDEETFTVTLSQPSVAAVIGDGVARGVIEDNDEQPTLRIVGTSQTDDTETLVDEGDTGERTAMEFRVILSETSGRAVSVDYQVKDGTAESGEDYTLSGGTLTFAAGVSGSALTQTIRGTVIGDDLDEDNETLTVSLSGLVNAQPYGGESAGNSKNPLGGFSGQQGPGSEPPVVGPGTNPPGFKATLNQQAFGRIIDDDSSPVLDAIEDVTVQAGQAVDITASATDADGDTITYAWTRKDGETTPALPPGASLGQAQLAFTPLATGTYTMTVTADDGNKNRDSEEVVITVTPAPSATVSVPKKLTFAESAGNVTFKVTASESFGKAVTFEVSYSGTARGAADVADGDYDNDAVTEVVFNAGDTEKEISVPINDDTLAEGEETIIVTLALAEGNSLPDGHTAGNLATTVNITDNDTLDKTWTLSLAPNEVTEGAGETEVTVTATRSGTATAVADTDIAISVAGVTATAGEDFAAVGNFTISVPAGESSATGTFDLTPTDDALDEADETLVVSGTLADNSVAPATLTITDNDDAPALSIAAPAAVVEGDSGESDMDFTVTLSAASGRQVTVKYALGGGTATSGTDHAALAGGALTFAAGDTEKTLTVKVTGDELDEPDETVVMVLSEPVNATIAKSTVTATITDDDSSPVVAPLLAPAGKKVGETVEITAQATDDDGDTVGWTWTRVSGPALPQGAVVNRAKFSMVPTEAGAYALRVTADDDNGNTDSEDVTVTVAASATVSVPKTLTFAESAGNVTFKVTASESFGKAVTFEVSYSGTARGAADVADGDYDNDAVTEVVFNAGDTEKEISVPINDDTLAEGEETIIVTLALAEGNSLPDGHTAGNLATTVNITDNDTLDKTWTLSLAPNEVTEGAGETEVTVTATRSGTATAVADTDIAISVAGVTATAGEDFAAVGNFTISVPAGESSATGTFDLTPTDDALDEADETLVVSGTLADNSVAPATLTITDNDDAPALSIAAPAAVVEGDSGESDMDFTVTLSAASGRQVTVKYALGGGTATSGTDHAAFAGGALTFAAGDTEKTLTVGAGRSGGGYYRVGYGRRWRYDHLCVDTQGW